MVKYIVGLAILLVGLVIGTVLGVVFSKPLSTRVEEAKKGLKSMCDKLRAMEEKLKVESTKK